MDSVCNTIMFTCTFSLNQRWALANYVACWFLRTLAQPVFLADSLFVNLCLLLMHGSQCPVLARPLLTILLSPFKFPSVLQPRLREINWPCNDFSFQPAILSSFLCCLYCKRSLWAQASKQGRYFSSISWLRELKAVISLVDYLMDSDLLSMWACSPKEDSLKLS